MQFRDQTPPSAEGPPRALRALGLVSMAAVLISTFVTDPKPGLHGDGPAVIAGIAALSTGLLLSVRRHEWFDGARFIGLALVGAASILFAAIQPDSAGYAGVYFVMAIGGIRLSRDSAIVICGGTVGGLVLIQLLERENPAVIAGLLFSVLPWFLIMRLIRRLERISRPRLRFLFDHRLSNIVFGVLVIAGCLGAFLAPPFTGLDALGVVLLSLAVLLEDFAIVVVALVVGVAGVVLETVVGGAAIKGIEHLL